MLHGSAAVAAWLSLALAISYKNCSTAVDQLRHVVSVSHISMLSLSLTLSMGSVWSTLKLNNLKVQAENVVSVVRIFHS